MSSPATAVASVPEQNRFHQPMQVSVAANVLGAARLFPFPSCLVEKLMSLRKFPDCCSANSLARQGALAGPVRNLVLPSTFLS